MDSFLTPVNPIDTTLLLETRERSL